MICGDATGVDWVVDGNDEEPVVDAEDGAESVDSLLLLLLTLMNLP